MSPNSPSPCIPGKPITNAPVLSAPPTMRKDGKDRSPNQLALPGLTSVSPCPPPQDVAHTPAKSDLSVMTVAKEYDAAGRSAQESQNRLPPQPFTTFLKEHSVSLLVRTNFEMEPGMVTRSYSPSDMNAQNLGHLDLPTRDTQGGLPDAKEIKRFIERCSDHLESGRAIAVHCKGGFGRSVIFACCLAIHQYNVSGEALLGWVRVARPGSVNTTMQEKFLCSLANREDLHTYLQIGSRPQPACCSMQ
eukprot:gb/GFBE01060524.1/.p1 GENE.gb/GFBE01060524.1/~~gb/GFBE01060524.1/.p1  ORF type:complete len:247 (+),score=38.95 gb/GFBE01060524.1/:1-741(+)